MKPYQLHLCLFWLGIFLGSARTQEDDEPLAIDHYYSVVNDLDADYFISQVLPEMDELGTGAVYFGWPFGDIEVLQNEGKKYYCHAKKDICQTSYIHVSWALPDWRNR